ncbi:hypothetical protein [Nocardia sp. NBC_01730]|uniref:hypothetical protein n=1 Tax=Nocardia sp. NBC_01730 TaxID=2975998 RepID=UPI003FA3B55C
MTIAIGVLGAARDLDPDWELRDTGWHVIVDGDAPLDVDLRFPISLDQLGAVSPGYTANRAVNAVPAVCTAAPGIRTTAELPLFTALLARWPQEPERRAAEGRRVPPTGPRSPTSVRMVAAESEFPTVGPCR